MWNLTTEAEKKTHIKKASLSDQKSKKPFFAKTKSDITAVKIEHSIESKPSTLVQTQTKQSTIKSKETNQTKPEIPTKQSNDTTKQSKFSQFLTKRTKTQNNQTDDSKIQGNQSDSTKIPNDQSDGAINSNDPIKMVMKLQKMEDSIDLSNLTDEERETILRVLNKDDDLRRVQDSKISEVKAEINAMRLHSVIQEGQQPDKVCGRCHTTLGIIFGTGEICGHCNFRVCKGCRVKLLTGGWVCALCYKQNEICTHCNFRVCKGCLVKLLTGGWMCALCYKQNQLKCLNGDWLNRTSNLSKRNGLHKSAPDLIRASLRVNINQNEKLSGLLQGGGDTVDSATPITQKVSTKRYVESSSDSETETETTVIVQPMAVTRRPTPASRSSAARTIGARLSPSIEEEGLSDDSGKLKSRETVESLVLTSSGGCSDEDLTAHQSSTISSFMSTLKSVMSPDSGTQKDDAKQNAMTSSESETGAKLNADTTPVINIIEVDQLGKSLSHLYEQPIKPEILDDPKDKKQAALHKEYHSDGDIPETVYRDPSPSSRFTMERQDVEMTELSWTEVRQIVHSESSVDLSDILEVTEDDRDSFNSEIFDSPNFQRRDVVDSSNTSIDHNQRQYLDPNGLYQDSLILKSGNINNNNVADHLSLTINGDEVAFDLSASETSSVKRLRIPSRGKGSNASGGKRTKTDLDLSSESEATICNSEIENTKAQMNIDYKDDTNNKDDTNDKPSMDHLKFMDVVDGPKGSYVIDWLDQSKAKDLDSSQSHSSGYNSSADMRLGIDDSPKMENYLQSKTDINLEPKTVLESDVSELKQEIQVDVHHVDQIVYDNQQPSCSNNTKPKTLVKQDYIYPVKSEQLKSTSEVQNVELPIKSEPKSSKSIPNAQNVEPLLKSEPNSSKSTPKTQPAKTSKAGVRKSRYKQLNFFEQLPKQSKHDQNLTQEKPSLNAEQSVKPQSIFPSEDSAKPKPRGLIPTDGEPVIPDIIINEPGRDPNHISANKRLRIENGRKAKQESEGSGSKASSMVSDDTHIPITISTPSPHPSASIVLHQDEVDNEDEDISDIGQNHHYPRHHTNLLGQFADSMESLTSSLYSTAPGSGYGVVTISGAIFFGISYVKNTLKIDVKQCSDLAAVDTKRGRSDPYVKAYLLPDQSKTGKRKTRVKKRTVNPVFNETLMFSIEQPTVGTRTLWLSVWHCDRLGRNVFLGDVNYNLGLHDFSDTVPMWLALQDSFTEQSMKLTYAGEVDVAVMYVEAEKVNAETKKKTTKLPGMGQVHVHVKRARNLVSVRTNGSAEPFVKGHLLPDKQHKEKSHIAKHTLKPEWDSTLVFNCPKADLSQRCVELTIWDHDRVVSNDFLGGVRVNLGTVKHTEVKPKLDSIRVFNCPKADLSQRCVELTIWDHDRVVSIDFLGGVRLNLGTGCVGEDMVDWMDARDGEVDMWSKMMDQPGLWHERSLPLRSHMQRRK